MASNRVQEYYDANTKRFLRFGQGGQDGAIHRAVWGPGAQTQSDAFRYVDDRMIAMMPDETRRVLDLGCGVGASLEYLVRERGIEGVGVTLSGVQAELANERFTASDLEGQLRCIQGDFTALPKDLGQFDFAFGIESFLHAPSPAAFFSEAARVVRPGGVLALCDDFASKKAESGEVSFRERRWLREFREGWNVGSLVSVEHAASVAEQYGFELVHDEDLTDYLELRRPRDHVITAMVRLGRHVPTRNPWWLNMLGGNALQMLQVRRLVVYQLAAWRRRD